MTSKVAVVVKIKYVLRNLERGRNSVGGGRWEIYGGLRATCCGRWVERGGLRKMADGGGRWSGGVVKRVL